jgi:plasmid stabilization system protein ParE
MSEVVWTGQARQDLVAISDAVAAAHPQAALRLIIAIEHQVAQLEMVPESGRRVPELARSPQMYRELIVQNSRVISRDSAGKVYVLHVRHGRRRVAGLPEES